MSTPSLGRVLGLDLRSRYAGYVCIETPKAMLDFGITTYTSSSRAAARIHSLFQKLHPTVLVLGEITPDSRRYQPKTMAIRAIAGLSARQVETQVIVIMDSQLDDFFALHNPRTKHEVATRIAQLYPELVWHLPHPRKPWEPQQRYMPLFDAAALALAFIELSKRGELFAGLPAV